MQDTGAISAGTLDNYNTSICISALSRLKGEPQIDAAIEKGLAFLSGLQWKVGMKDPNGDTLTEDHPYFGGAGYGKHGRPDLSNTQFMVQAFRDAGRHGQDDPAVQRALRFALRLQGHAENELFTEDPIASSDPGSFVYATAINSEAVVDGRSVAIENKADQDTIDDFHAHAEAYRSGERTVSNLRGYGSMTSAGFHTMLYAGLSREDDRVQSTWRWLQDHFVTDHNPGMPIDETSQTHLQGLYYYYVTLSRALSAFGEPILEQTDGTQIDWQNAVIAALGERQSEDGSWINTADRWSEGDPALVTAYALITLNYAIGHGH